MTTDSGDEFSYVVPGWLWTREPDQVLRRARETARSKDKDADGEPQVHVVLVWPQDTTRP